MDGVDTPAVPAKAAKSDESSYGMALAALCVWAVIAVVLFLPIIMAMWMALDIGDDGPVLATWLVPSALLVLLPAATGAWRAFGAAGPQAKRMAEFMTAAAVTAAACGLGSLIVLALIYAARY